MSGFPSPTPAGRDRDLRRVRGAAWAAGTAAAVLATGLSVAAANAFKGHDGRARTSTPAQPAQPARSARVRVPPAQHVPAIAGAPVPLQPPAAPPTAAPPQPAPQAETSGGS